MKIGQHVHIINGLRYAPGKIVAFTGTSVTVTQDGYDKPMVFTSNAGHLLEYRSLLLDIRAECTHCTGRKTAALMPDDTQFASLAHGIPA